MYNHSNLSQTSTGSGRRISLNNPFRSALIAEEAKLSSTTNNNTEEYRQWVENNKKLLQEEEEEQDEYSDDNFDFIDTSRSLPKTTATSSAYKPQLLTAKSDSSVMSEQKYKNNPFADALSPESTGATNTSETNTVPRNVQPQQRQQARLVSPTEPSRPSVDRTQKPLVNENYYDDHDLPPSYEEITTRYGKNEYPPDIKIPINSSSSSSSPPPPSHSRRNSPTKIDVNGTGSRSRRMPNLTSTMVTNVSTGHTRTRSRSEGEASRHPSRSSSTREHRHRDRSERSERSERPERSGRERSDRERSDREHRHSQHHHSSSASKHRSSKSKKPAAGEKPKNLDVIDKLDVTGFLGGTSFHHDGPFDACTPHRNKNAKAAPVMAFPADGPNNSIKGAAPAGAIKDQQMDMMFGVSEPVYSTSVQNKHRSPYSNGVVVKEATASSSTLLESKAGPGIIAFDANAKAAPVHGDTTLGLGSSTFLDGAPAYGAATERKGSGDLTRKKSIVDRLMKKDDEPSGLIRRVKSLKVSRNRS